MARGPTVRIEGAKELRKALKQIDSALPKEMTRIHREVAEPVADRAGMKVPRRSGKLAGSLKPAGTTTAARVQAGSGSVPYAGPIHYGWHERNIEPQPFLVSALEDSETKVLDIYDRLIEVLIESVFGRSV